MKRVKYVSRYTTVLTEQDIETLTAQAAANNRALDVTGVLLASEGLFVQVLEGPNEAVDRLMDAISKDPRHQDVLVLFVEDPIETRLFPDWSMRRLQLASGSRERLEPLRALLAVITEQRSTAQRLTQVLERAVWREMMNAVSPGSGMRA